MVLGGQFGALVLNSLVIYPVTKRILVAHERVPNLKTRKLLAVLFLALVGLLSVGIDLAGIIQEPNLFKELRVRRDAEDKDIRASYQKLAKELHPDRNRDNPRANEEFQEMKTAYDVLANPNAREVYDAWGFEGLRWLQNGKDVMTQGLIQLGISYVIWFALTVLLTLSSSHTHARTISLAGLSLLIAIDLHIHTSKVTFFVPFLSHLAVYQLSKLLFTLYPTFISGAVVYQNVTFVDPAERNWKIMNFIFSRQSQIVENLTNLENEMRLTKKVGAIPSAGPVGAGGAAAATSNLPRNQQPRSAVGHGDGGNNNAPKKRQGIPSWIMLLAVMFLFNYILK